MPTTYADKLADADKKTGPYNPESKNCPPIPTFEQLKSEISNILKGTGADQTCVSELEHLTETEFSKKDLTGFLLTPGALGAATGAQTDTNTKIKNKLNQSGCSDVYADINQQLVSRRSVVCKLNNISQDIGMDSSVDASINIKVMAPTAEQVKIRTAAIAALEKVRPSQVDQNCCKEEWQFKIVAASTERLLENWTNRIAALGAQDVNINNNKFKTTVTGKVRQITDTKKISVNSIKEDFRAAAQSAAEREIKSKSGVGVGENKNLKSVITNNLDTRDEAIKSLIENSSRSVDIKSDAKGGFTLTLWGDDINFNNNLIDNHAQINIMSENIMNDARTMGSEIANGILTNNSSATVRESEIAGVEELMQRITKGYTELSKATSSGVDSMWGAIGSIGNFGMLIALAVGVGVLLFLPQVSNIIAPGPLKYVLAAVLIYLIVAWFMSLWPFTKSENSTFERTVNNNLINNHTSNKLKKSYTKYFNPITGPFIVPSW